MSRDSGNLRINGLKYYPWKLRTVFARVCRARYTEASGVRNSVSRLAAPEQQTTAISCVCSHARGTWTNYAISVSLATSAIPWSIESSAATAVAIFTNTILAPPLHRAGTV